MGSFAGMMACALLQGAGFGLCWPSIIYRGLAEGITATAAREAGCWVFAAFVPVLGIGMVSAWRFSAEP